MAVIGLGAHTQRAPAMALAEETAVWLRREGHDVRMLTVARGDGAPPVPDEVQQADLDLLVSLGGDGTMLRAVGLVSPDGVPVLGVNFGTLGYLTTVEPGDLADALRRFLAGDCVIETRMMLDLTVRGEGGRGPELLHTSALNDVVLQRPAGGHTVRAALCVNETPFLTYAADALLVATPTGSTAYNLSARGPVLSPETRALVVTPVAPHMLFDRSLVLDATESVSIEPVDGRDAELLVDGWVAYRLHPGEVLTCRQAKADARLVGFGGRDYLAVLKRKFNLGTGAC
jgi:NAD+ kinase